MSELRPGHALIIGINAYTGGISPLQSAVADASALAELLKKDHDYSVDLLLDATRKSIAESLEKLQETLNQETAFLIYFAGHGVARGDGHDGPKGFLLPQDALLADTASWISMEWLRCALESLPCKHLLVVLDCCFAGSFRWASTRSIHWGGEPMYDSQFERYLKGTAWQALTSASADEKALDLAPGALNTRDTGDVSGHSPFAAAFMRGLSGAADSSRGDHEPDGVMTATELLQYTYEELVPPDQSTHQTPGIWPLKPDNQGEYIFRSPGHARKTIPDPPLDDKNNPWLGLKSYTTDQRRLFFGRDRVIRELLERLADAPGLLAVLGASGTGKSSVVKAGLIPRLLYPEDTELGEAGNWGVVEMSRLGKFPGRELDVAIDSLDKIETGRRRLLLIDQFEELYTLARDGDARDAFLTRLRQLIDDQWTTVVLTLRSDFEPRPAASKALRDLWNKDKTRYVVPPFSLEEYRDCIEGPAHAKAVYFEPASLIDELLDEVASNPGVLPMLSFALAEMYRCAQVRRRSSGANDRALMREDYESIGGMIGAMHRRATVLYEESDAASQSSIARIFLRMLSSDGGRITRRRVSRYELEWADQQENERIDRVLQQYIDARLLVADGNAIEPAHDTLVAAWDLLLDWRQTAKPQQLLRTVWRDASDWLESDHEQGLLWDNHPQRLAEAESREDELNRLEAEFIAAGRKLFKRKRLKRWVISAAVTAVISAIAFLAVLALSDAYTQWDERDDAEVARDKLFLEFHAEQGSTVYKPWEILDGTDGNSMSLVDTSLEHTDPDIPYLGTWHVLSGTADNALIMAAVSPPLLLESGEVYRVENEEVLTAEGRVVAVGHENLLGLTEQPDNVNEQAGNAARIIRHSLSWLETDPWSPVYIYVGGDDRSNGFPEDLQPLQRIPAGFDACIDPGEDWFVDREGIRISAGADDPVFRGSALHTRLWQWGYCEIYAVSRLSVLDSQDVSQGVLIVINARQLTTADIASIQEWVTMDDNGLLVSGTGVEWLEEEGGDLSLYPMNQAMRLFNLQWTDRVIRSDR